MVRETTPDDRTWSVMGRTLGLPVEVRAAAQWGAQYLVSAAAAP